LKSALLEHGFWATVTELLELFKPIHKIQKMLESNKATIGYVFQYWIDVESHLKKMAANSKIQFSPDVGVPSKQAYHEPTETELLELETEYSCFQGQE
jgi:hypothetical protein